MTCGTMEVIVLELVLLSKYEKQFKRGPIPRFSSFVTYTTLRTKEEVKIRTLGCRGKLVGYRFRLATNSEVR